MTDHRISVDPITGDVTVITITDAQLSAQPVRDGEILAAGAEHGELVANIKAALASARAQGAAEERERLAKDADNRADVNSHLPPEMTHDWDHFAQWLRSNTGEG